MNEKCKKYDDMSDVFEYWNISDDEIVKLCNQILLESKDEKNDIILETMYHAVFTAANYRNIADKIEIDSILDYIEYFNEEISDYIISILAFTGRRKYINIIKSIGEKYGDLDISEAIGELESRCKSSEWFYAHHLINASWLSGKERIDKCRAGRSGKGRWNMASSWRWSDIARGRNDIAR